MNSLTLAFLVARREYLRTVRRRGYLVATLLIPLGAGAIFFIAQLFSAPSGPSLDPTVYLVDESGLHLRADPQSPKVEVVDRPTGEQLLDTRTTDELYVLSRDYTVTGVVERVIRRSGGDQSFEVQALTRHAIEEQRLTTYLRRALIGDRLPAEERERIVAPVQVRDVLPGGQPAPPPDIAHFLLPYAFALLFLLSLFITSGYLLQSVTEERETRAVEIVVSSVPVWPLMAGKVLGLGGAGLTQVVVWVVSAQALPHYASVAIPGLSNISAPAGVLALAILFFVLGYALYSGIYAAIGALAPGTREAQQYAGFLAIFAVLPLIATSAFLNDPHQPIVIAMALVPFTAPAAMLQILALEETIPWPLVIASLAILAASAAVVTVASARVFRATVLLYGKRPSIGAIVSAVLARG